MTLQIEQTGDRVIDDANQLCYPLQTNHWQPGKELDPHAQAREVSQFFILPDLFTKNYESWLRFFLYSKYDIVRVRYMKKRDWLGLLIRHPRQFFVLREKQKTVEAEIQRRMAELQQEQEKKHESAD